MPKSQGRPVKTSKKYRKKLVLALLVLIVAAGVGYALTRNNHTSVQNGPTTTAKKTAKTSTGSSVNLSPPTPEQQNAARDQSSTQQVQATNNDGRKLVTPVITEATAQEVRAYVDGVIEDGGTCTATYTHGGDVITASSKGLGDAGHTTCGPMRPPGAVNIPGDWSVTVTYSSSGYYGKSQAQTFKVQ